MKEATRENEIAQPVIRKALGKNWDSLSSIVKQHYDITPGIPENMLLKGEMDEVYHSHIAKLFLVPGRLFGALVPYKGKNIATVVKNWTTAENHAAMFWHRTLRFPGKAPFIFRSRMEHIGNNEIIEYVRFGMGIRMRMTVVDGALVFRSTGYQWTIGGIRIPIPTWAILGDATIIEKPVSNNRFYIDFTMTHPVFGKTFSYSGTYKIVTDAKSPSSVQQVQ